MRFPLCNFQTEPTLRSRVNIAAALSTVCLIAFVPYSRPTVHRRQAQPETFINSDVLLFLSFCNLLSATRTNSWLGMIHASLFSHWALKHGSYLVSKLYSALFTLYSTHEYHTHEYHTQLGTVSGWLSCTIVPRYTPMSMRCFVSHLHDDQYHKPIVVRRAKSLLSFWIASLY